MSQTAVTIGANGTFNHALPLRENDVFLIVLAKQGRKTRVMSIRP